VGFTINKTISYVKVFLLNVNREIITLRFPLIFELEKHKNLVRWTSWLLQR